MKSISSVLNAWYIVPALLAWNTVSAKTGIVLIVQEGLGQELFYAARLYKPDSSIWQWRIDPDWGSLSLSTYPLQATATPNAAQQDESLLYDPLIAWNGAFAVNPETSEVESNFNGYKWTVESATDARTASTAITTGFNSFTGSINWLNFPEKKGSPTPLGDHLLEWARQQGLSTGIISNVPFSDPSFQALAGLRVDPRDDDFEFFEAIIQSQSLDLMVATGHPEFDPAGTPLGLPEYNCFTEDDWEDFRRDTNSYNWQTLFGDDDLMSMNTEPSDMPQKRIVLQEFGDTRDVERLNIGFSLTEKSIQNSMRIQTLKGLEHLNQNPEGWLLIVHLGQLPHIIKADRLQFALEQVTNNLHLMYTINEWLSENGVWAQNSLIYSSSYEYGLIWGSDSLNFPFAQILDRGPNRLPGMRVNHKGPTNSLVPLLYRGQIKNQIDILERKEDTIYGEYLHLTSINQSIKGLASTDMSPEATITQE